MGTLLNCKIFLKQSPVLIEYTNYKYMFNVLTKEKYRIENIDRETQTATIRKVNNSYVTKTIDLLETYVFPYVVTPNDELYPLSLGWQSVFSYEEHSKHFNVNIINGFAEKYDHDILEISINTAENTTVKVKVTPEQHNMLEDFFANNPHVRLTEK